MNKAKDEGMMHNSFRNEVTTFRCPKSTYLLTLFAGLLLRLPVIFHCTLRSILKHQSQPNCSPFPFELIPENGR